MVIDTSALVAVLNGEPERDEYWQQILRSRTRLLSAANAFETGMVLEGRRGPEAGREYDLFLLQTDITIVPVDREQAEVARAAWRKYGKGRHPAGLNFGDCFAYALARSSGEKLLAKGGDFKLTDIELI